MSHAPLISICIPIYRRTAFLKECLEMTLSQDADNFEIIVNDDTEDDSVRRIVESFASPKIRYYHQNPPRGLIAKLNDFSDYVRGDWLVYLCDDDFLLPSYVAAVTRQLAVHPDAALVRVRQRTIDIDGKEMRLDPMSPEVSSPFAFLSQLFRPDVANFRINVTGVAFQKSLFDKVGRVKNFGRTWHVDRLAWAEMGALGNVICDPEIHCELRLHGLSLTSSIDADYVGAISSSILIKESVQAVLADLDRRAASDEDRALCNKARVEFAAYMQRHLARSFDQGLLAAFDDPKRDVRAALKTAEDEMRLLEVSHFPSLRLYRVLSFLPSRMRTYAMTRLKRAKLAKRNTA